MVTFTKRMFGRHDGEFASTGFMKLETFTAIMEALPKNSLFIESSASNLFSASVIAMDPDEQIHNHGC